MFGPLPALHKYGLITAAVIVWVGLGFWAGAMPDIPLTVRAGLVAGTAAGVCAAYLLVHDFHHGGGTRHSRASARARHRA